MPYLLGDVYIGSFPVTQDFGSDPNRYHSLWNLKGHNGVDFGCPTLTLILSAADGLVSDIGFDEGGYGNYIKVVHDGYLTLYGHLNDIVVKKGDHVVAGQLIAHSNNTGFSSGPHLHFGVAPCDAQGNKTDPNNGYSGYIDPMSSACKWEIKNLTAPVVPGGNEAEQKISVPASDFTTMIPQGSNYKIMATYAVSIGANDYLTAHNLPPIDLINNPKDPMAGENLVKFFQAELNKPAPEPSLQALEKAVVNAPQNKKNAFTSFLQTIGILKK